MHVPKQDSAQSTQPRLASQETALMTEQDLALQQTSLHDMASRWASPPPAIGNRADFLRRFSTASPAIAHSQLQQMHHLVGNRQVNQVVQMAQQKGNKLSGASPGAPVLGANQGGRPLPGAVQAKMDHSFSTDFSNVRIHTGAAAASIGAMAYTQGNHIHFAPGQYRPQSASGQTLLGHELAHVVQQRAGQVQALQGKGITLNVNRTLEADADVMGAQAARGEVVNQPKQRSNPGIREVIQPRLGFEIEMLALVDISGRPIPEKVTLGTAGAHNVELTVDHGPAVDAPTPTPAHQANFSVPGMGAAGGPLVLRAYDTPPGTETKMDFPVGAPPPGPDPRAANAVNLLNWANWAAATATIDRTRTRNPDNGPIGQIDALLLNHNYQRLYDNWESASAIALLVQIRNHINNWNALNPNANTRFGRLFSNAKRTRRYNAANLALANLNAEATAHITMWTANPNPPAAMTRQYRQPAGAVMGPWNAAHPTFQPQEGMGRDRYASILEIVTPGGPGFEPETVAGRANIIGAMTEAVNLATAIEASTNNFANRVPLNTIAGVNAVTNPNIFVGNPLQPAQTTDASIQSTFAVDLAQLPSYVMSTLGFGGQNLYGLKHPADTFAPLFPGMQPVAIDRAKVELNRAQADASAIIHAVGRPGGPGAPSLANLRGLLVIICQYLRMGKYYVYQGQPGLDKNIVDMLSRTDLAVIYQRNVPGPAATPNTEQNWVSANLPALMNQIRLRTGRTGATRLFTDQAEAWAAPPVYPPHYLVTVDQFLTNIFTQPSDGVTPHFGGWGGHTYPTEDIDPAGARPGDSRPVGAAHREGPVFELRNMVPTGGGGRFPHAQWIPLATYMANVLASLNARAEAAAGVRDVRYAQNAGALANQRPW